MKINSEGLALIKSFESCRLTAYKAVSTEKYYTIGWGHYGADVTQGMRITQTRADALLVSDLAKFEAKVDKYMNKYHFNENQYAALVSFAYNVGSIDGLTKNGTRSIAQISAKFTSYNKSGGKILAGLTRRRQAERKLFNKACSSVSFVFDGVDYSRVFDPNFYADANADLKAAFGYDASKLFEHFRVYGCTEISRAGRTISTFNVEVYKAHSEDLRKAFGNDLRAYYRHYCVNGYKENRRVI